MSPWATLERLFEALWGKSAHSLPRFPDIHGIVSASWIDKLGTRYTAKHLNEVRDAYARDEPVLIEFSGGLGDPVEAYLRYWPKTAEIEAELTTGDPRTAERLLETMRREFPLPTSRSGANVHHERTRKALPSLLSRGWWSENKAWAVPVAASLFVALIGGAWQVFVWWSGGRVTAAEQIRACERQHGMSSAREERQQGRKRIFAACEWPPPDYATHDGYSEVRVTFGDGPGDSEASGATDLDRLRPTCRRVKVAYSFGTQGDYDRYEPFVVDLGEVVQGRGGEPWRGEAPYPYPERDEIVIVNDGDLSLDTARCLA